MPRMLDYVTIAYLGFMNATNLFAADPSHVKNIAEYVRDHGNEIEFKYPSGSVKGKGLLFKVPAVNGTKEIIVSRFVYDGLEQIVFIHQADLDGIKSQLELLETANPKYDGKIDSAHAVLEIKGQEVSVPINLKSELGGNVQAIHDETVPKINEQIVRR